MTQIVAGQEAIELGEFLQNQIALFAAATQHLLVNAPFRGRRAGQLFRQFSRHGARIKDIATQQHRAQAFHVIGGFAIHQRTLA